MWLILLRERALTGCSIPVYVGKEMTCRGSPTDSEVERRREGGTRLRASYRAVLKPWAGGSPALTFIFEDCKELLFL